MFLANGLMVQGPGDPTDSVINPRSEAKAFSLWQRSWETDEECQIPRTFLTLSLKVTGLQLWHSASESPSFFAALLTLREAFLIPCIRLVPCARPHPPSGVSCALLLSSESVFPAERQWLSLGAAVPADQSRAWCWHRDTYRLGHLTEQGRFPSPSLSFFIHRMTLMFSSLKGIWHLARSWSWKQQVLRISSALQR